MREPLAAPAPSDGRARCRASRRPGTVPRISGWKSDPDAREVVRLREPPVLRGKERGACATCCACSKRRAQRLQAPGACSRTRFPGWETEPHAREVVRLGDLRLRAREERGEDAACCILSKRRRSRRQAPGACRRTSMPGWACDPDAREVVRLGNLRFSRAAL